MTTKQEIIEFIENKLQVVKIDKLGKFVINSEFASKELIQMIKELELKVKPLHWYYDENGKGKGRSCWISEECTVCNYMNLYEIMHFNDTNINEQKQECQKDYEESILKLVDYE